MCPGSLSNPIFFCSRWWAGLDCCAAGVRVHPTSSRQEIVIKNSPLLDFQGVSKAQSWKSLWQGLTTGIWPSWLLQLLLHEYSYGKKGLEITALETSVGKKRSGLEMDYLGQDPGKSSQVQSLWKFLYHVGMTFSFLWNIWGFPKITYSRPNGKGCYPESEQAVVFL